MSEPSLKILWLDVCRKHEFRGDGKRGKRTPYTEAVQRFRAEAKRQGLQVEMSYSNGTCTVSKVIVEKTIFRWDEPI